MATGWAGTVWLCHPLEQHRTAAAADQAAHPIAQDAVLLEGDHGLAMLPAQTKIVACDPLLLSSTKIGRLLRLHTLLREERTLGAHSLHTVSYSLGGMSPTGTAIAAHSGAQEQPRDSHALCSLSGGMNSTPDFSARC